MEQCSSAAEQQGSSGALFGCAVSRCARWAPGEQQRSDGESEIRRGVGGGLNEAGTHTLLLGARAKAA